MERYTEIGDFIRLKNEVRLNHDYKGNDDNGNPLYINTSPYPTLKFRGTVKIHGTNASISKTKNGDNYDYKFHSRDRVLSLKDDNSEFMKHMLNLDYISLFNTIEFNERCVIYGEWCGKGIMKGTGINQLDKLFVIFGIRIDGNYVDLDKYKHVKNERDRIFNILDFKQFEITIDFNELNKIYDEIVRLTLEVETSCPVAERFGINGIGEGIVWECYYENLNRFYRFKSKGEKHKHKIKEKIDKINPQQSEFEIKCEKIAISLVPSWRLEQMLYETCNLNNGGCVDKIYLGKYIKSIIEDIEKEEYNVLKENNLTIKDISRYVSNLSKKYFLEQESQF